MATRNGSHSDQRDAPSRSPSSRPLRLLAGALLVAVLAIGACGGESSGGESDAVAAQASPHAEASPAVDSDAPAQVSPAGTVAAIEPRDDGLTGAPVPQTEAQSAEFDADLLSQGGGRFPPLDDPTIVTAEGATWMSDDTLVLGAVQNGEARAYPIAMMRYHHVSNDVLGGEPYLVTF